MHPHATAIRTALSIAALATVLALTGCATETSATETTGGNAASDTEADTEAEPDSGVVTDDTEAEEAAEEDTMFSLNDEVVLPGWEVKVTNIALNANDIINKANQFNDAPKGQYVLATYEGTYTGTERTADVVMDMSWSLTTTDNKVNDEAYQVTQADNEDWPTETRKGGTIEGQILFDVPKGKVKGGILSVEVMDNESFDTTYADWAID